MAKGLPSHHLLAEPLEWGESGAWCVLSYRPREPTLVIFSKLFDEQTLKTFTATWRPSYFPFQTSAYPPW